MQVYIRHIHKITNNEKTAEADTVGPFDLQDLTLAGAKKLLQKEKQIIGTRLAANNRRAQDGGWVFFYPDPKGFDYKGIYPYHCTMIMPLRSELHYKHAPPSHWATKILVPMYLVRSTTRGRDFMCDILGGKVTGDNVYIATYSSAIDPEADSGGPGWPKTVDKHPTKLECGEICLRTYNLCGGTTHCFVERVL